MLQRHMTGQHDWYRGMQAAGTAWRQWQAGPIDGWHWLAMMGLH